MKKKIIVLILLFGLITLFENKVYCQSIEITGMEPITLTISTATAGGQPDDPDPDESTGLTYNGNPLSPLTNYKITVKTNLSPPKFTLKVEAVSLISGLLGSAGNAQPEVTLSTTDPTDPTGQVLITGIQYGLTPHTCTLKYTASATVAKGTGTDFHTITYTITQQ